MDYQETLETSHKNIISDEESIVDSPAKRWLSWVSDLKIESYNTPPMYGDYEAQRHWMELTLHVPINRWYYYDLDWWGLDYPPLTAYVSWICGKIGSILDPTWFALDSSRGYESDESKLFMRSTVLICDYLIYVPAVLVFVNWWFAGNSWKKRELAVLLILLQPALILIDHGHFQYNSVMLGLTLWAVNCFFYDHDVLGSIFFCLALSFKQMALYFAPAIFSYLLGKCIKNDIRGVMKLGITVIITFGIVFYPFLGTLEQISQVIIRIFPLQRGLYEDKVANIWCAINVIIKLREIFDISLLAKISLITTLFAILPSCIYLGSNPDKRYLIYGLANSSLAFFLFSFQVHEKSILLPALPICLLILDDVFWLWLMWNWIGSFIKKDTKPIILKYLSWLSYFVMALIHILEFNIPPPKRYPDIYIVLNVIFSAG
ncbi:15009_t:CDS:2, partial [Gigaspora rosea]